MGNAAIALSYFEAAEVFADKCNLLEEQAYLINNMGIIYGQFGQYHKSLEAYLEAAEISRQLGDEESLSVD